MNLEFYRQLVMIAAEENVQADEPMKAHTTFRVGGPADYFVTPESVQELEETVQLCRQFGVPYYIIGNGSNLLVSDQGYRGAIIQIYRKMNHITVEDDIVSAEAGALLSAVAASACKAKLTGFEFASGIPGTLGGACVMNAGAYGGEMKDVLRSVTVLDASGRKRTYLKNQLEMGYRTSVIAKNGDIVLGAELELEEGKPDAIRARMDELKIKRTTKQPLEYASAGSTFKRPEGYFAGKLIQDAGLQGFRCGGAQVSEKHCGFVVNCGDATALDVVTLINHIVKTVEDQSGVRLETEVKRLGEF